MISLPLQIVSFGSISILFVVVLNLSFKSTGKEESNHADDSDQQEPYGYFSHPHKNFLDKVIGIIVGKLLNVQPIVNCPCVMNTNTTSAGKNDKQQPNNQTNKNDKIDSSLSVVLSALRERMTKNDKFEYYSHCKAWSKLIKKENKNDSDFLVGGTFLVPRNSSILSDWGIINSNDDNNISSNIDHSNLKNSKEQDFIEVELLCPASAINGSFDIIDKTTSTCGYETISNTNNPTSLEDLKLSPDVDIILDFHGGGMMIGSAKHGSSGVVYVNALIEMQCNEQKRRKEQQGNGSGEEKNTSSLCPGLILLSVNYRLAPDHPFPAQIIDGLSVSSHIFQYYPDSNIHFSGISAGANLSAVVGLESLRYYATTAAERRIKR